MKSSAMLLFLVLLFSFAQSFDPSDYLYENETSDSISTEDFKLNGFDYSIVTIDGKEAFLVSEEKLVENESEIDQVIYGYYLEKHFPSDQELQNIKDLLDTYNKSRNDGELKPYPGKEEYTCREIIFADGRVKSGQKPVACKPDLDNCNYSAMFFYSYLSAVSTPPFGSWTDLVKPIKEFSFASYYTEYILDNVSSKLETAEKEEVYDALQYLQDSLPELESHQSDIEDTEFGRLWKESTQSWVYDKNHWGYCPPLRLNGSALDELESETDAILTKMVPFSDYKTVSGSIYSSTQARLKYVSEELNTTYYSSLYDPLAVKGIEVIEFGEYTEERITNSSFESDLSSLKSLHNKINNSIKGKDFSTIESDLSKYSSLIPKVNRSSQGLFEIYNESITAKNNADSLIFILDTKDLDPLTYSDFEKLKNKTADIDVAFRDGLDPESYKAFTANYSEIITEANKILRKSREGPGSMMFLSFRSFARRVNSGLATFLESSDVMPAKDVPMNKTMTFGGFSLLTFISLGAICLLIFLGLLVRNSLMKHSLRVILIVVFLIAMLSLTAFSAFLFLFMDRTSTDADIEEFLIDLGTKERVGVIVDLSSAPSGAKDSMESCGATLVSSFNEKNKSVAFYTMGSSGCTLHLQGLTENRTSSLTIEECMDSVANETSVITLNYSSSLERPQFSIIYTSRANIAADLSYYSSCPLTAIFG